MNLNIHSIFLDHDLNVKLLDLSLCAETGQKVQVQVWKRKYMIHSFLAPELLSDDQDTQVIGHFADVFNLGSILFFLLYGSLPFQWKASSYDYLYKYIYNKKFHRYWQNVDTLFKSVRASHEFKCLVNSLN